MNKQANILFISPSIGGNSAEPRDALSQYDYFQQLIYASLARNVYVGRFQVLGRQLAAIARHAHLVRQMDAVEQASQVMLALPISSQLKGIARYYQALCIKHQGDFDGARRSLERAAEEATPQYRARALLTIGATYYESGELDAALPFYLAAGRGACERDLLTLVESQRMTAVVRSVHGDHRQALGDLERLFPLVRAIGKYYPAAYYDFLNSLAVELGEVGRIADAKAALSIALASPFARAYPEWSETRDEIAARRVSATPSVVAFNRAPEAAPSPQAAPERKPKPVSKLALLRWPACKKIFLQRALKTIAVTSAIPHAGITQSILDRVLICIGPRAPPARF
ncbi:MAG: tetratricopeptide repeat protein [Acidobacteriota bacterium]